MDPFSQAALGAVVGQLVGQRTLGYKAAAFGALAGALPDVDVLFSVGGDFVDQLVLHRGITHSLFFAPVVGPILGWLIWHQERRRSPDPGDGRRRISWMLVLTMALWSHPLLDLLTPYGTQLLLPFSDARFAINAMPIIDPVYTLLLFGGLFLAWLPALRSSVSATVLATFTLVLSSSYLGYGWLQGVRAEAAARDQLAQAGIVPDRLAAFPTILQVHLRRMVARDASVDRVGFYSTLNPCEIDWHEAPRARQTELDLLAPFLQTRAGEVFDWFTMGWAHYDMRRAEQGWELTASDLRYGFEDDPRISIFTLHASLRPNGTANGLVATGRTRPSDPERAFERLLMETYAPACRVLGARGASAEPRSGDEIDGYFDDNGAEEGAEDGADDDATLSGTS